VPETEIEARRRISAAGKSGGRRKRIEAVVDRIIIEYAQGRAASACMGDLMREASK